VLIFPGKEALHVKKTKNTYLSHLAALKRKQEYKIRCLESMLIETRLVFNDK